MGAKMMPIEKNRGRTVLGVRMGLVAYGQLSVPSPGEDVSIVNVRR